VAASVLPQGVILKELAGMYYGASLGMDDFDMRSEGKTS
jgi:hypothetical protein